MKRFWGLILSQCAIKKVQEVENCVIFANLMNKRDMMILMNLSNWIDLLKEWFDGFEKEWFGCLGRCWAEEPGLMTHQRSDFGNYLSFSFCELAKKGFGQEKKLYANESKDSMQYFWGGPRGKSLPDYLSDDVPRFVELKAFSNRL